eukprot:scaffold84846_cov72-Cyclotella_meneghiniana.AAC.2
MEEEPSVVECLDALAFLNAKLLFVLSVSSWSHCQPCYSLFFAPRGSWQDCSCTVLRREPDLWQLQPDSNVPSPWHDFRLGGHNTTASITSFICLSEFLRSSCDRDLGELFVLYSVFLACANHYILSCVEQLGPITLR